MEFRVVDNVLVVALKGSLKESKDAAEIRERVSAELSAGRTSFIIDFSQSDYVNSEGLSCLLELFKRIKQAGGRLILADVGKRVSDILRVTKLNHVFEMAESLEQALGRLR